ncbi:MAG: biotin transporter BioY [Paracoccaceae bacterium]
MTLLQAAFGPSTLVKNIGLVLAGTLFIATAAQISVPMFPVPMTLQTLAIVLVGLTFGSRLAAVTVLAYLAQGAMGLPVFANAGNGAAFFGPTAGFLVGFVGLAWGVGFASERGWTKSVVSTALICTLVSLALYIPGVAWPMAVAGLTGLEAGWVGKDFTNFYWVYFVAPFLIGDVLKAVIAALVFKGARSALKIS